MSISGIILDFDGVVVDSQYTHIRAWKQAHEEFFKAELVNTRQLYGKAGKQIALELSLKAGDPQHAPELYKRKTELVLKWGVEVGIFPGTKEFFEKLHELKIPFGIGSNARSSFIEQLLKKFDLVAPVIVAVDHVYHPKPHPEPFLTCAEYLGIPEEENDRVYVFEDSPIGIEAAKSAGMVAVGITSQIDAETLREQGVAHVFDSLHESLPFIESLRSKKSN